jgi:hypothetical protein
MTMKLLGAFLAFGLTVGVPAGSEAPSGADRSCCTEGAACCNPPQECCFTSAVACPSDCCAGGLECCNPAQACCLSAGAGDCCASGQECCAAGAACCGTGD